ncbi:MAG: rubrerythrin, partial [Crenarchaeota archaeon]|nr:rubrerythrin [Thermoproteota archaeon]
MLGKNPIDITRKEPLSREEMIQAIRWAIMAELDAVNFYTQFAHLIQD